jgi:hypothetical protein
VLPRSKPAVRIHWRTTPPTPAQLAAWDRLWTRLLGASAPGPKTTQPQDPVDPGAVDCATVSSGHHLLSEIPNDIANLHRSK